MKIEIRADNTAIVTGYVNVVGRESRLLYDREDGDFIEIIKPKTFQRALEKADSVGLMFNHVRALGDTNDSLELYEDNIGLYAKATIRDAGIIQEAKDGKLTGWSFAFYLNEAEYGTRADGVKLRTVTDLDLVEVSLLDVTPAYIATSVELRDDTAKRKELRFIDGAEVENLEPKEDLEALELQKLDTKKRQFKLFLLNERM